ncbi:uncharacterized protein LOC101767792 [Setaria italica]|uniref:uncharacterized protein LOC101767792 n=1 Tax=Setaria italica TaxID=4555 RepID=UPI000BE55FE4|nr:uncharacterized protein LOC101767792 [Setaria italica]
MAKLLWPAGPAGRHGLPKKAAGRAWAAPSACGPAWSSTAGPNRARARPGWAARLAISLNPKRITENSKGFLQNVTRPWTPGIRGLHCYCSASAYPPYFIAIASCIDYNSSTLPLPDLNLMEAVEDAFLEGASLWLAQTILQSLFTGKLDEWIRQVGLADDAEKLKSEVERAEAVAAAVKGRTIGNRALARSLARLREVLYDADDVVDELDYYRLQHQVEGGRHGWRWRTAG